MVKAYAYSPSRLATYQGCPRQYYYRYVIKAPSKRHAAQSVGISLHGALEAVQQAGGVVETGVEGAIALLASRWESDGFADKREEEAARVQAEAMLAAYLARHGVGEGTPIMIEKKLTGRYADVPLLGIVDRVDRLPDGTLELIDYKSGRAAAHEPAVQQQLAIYRFLIKEQLGEYPARVAIHHLAANTRVAVDLAPGDWSGLLERAAQSAQSIERDEDFDPRIGSWCQRCDYNRRCIPFQRAQIESADQV
ncbi:MAG TPA: PD-(D/E)XK nuclease family protein [Oscillatoriaceae cyanobacterium]